MCGRYTLFVDREDLEERFDAQFASGESFSPRYNASPGQRLPVITDTEPETIRSLEWGLVPSWAEDATGGLINARAETVAEKPSFREAYAQRGEDEGDGTQTAGRCLVLADGFYEWVETEDGKQPYRVAFEDDRPFAMAGLWSTWEPATTQTGLDAFGGGTGEGERDDGNDALETFTILTTEPNDLVSDLHHRMAVILESDSERRSEVEHEHGTDRAAETRWLTDDDPRDLLEPHPSAKMHAYPVSTAVNNPANDDPSLIEALES